MEIIKYSLNLNDENFFDAFFQRLRTHFHYFSDILTDNNSITYKLSVGTIKPLGGQKLKICEFFAECVQLNGAAIFPLFYQYNIISRLLVRAFY